MALIGLALAAVAVWALVRLGRQTERRGRAHWRVTATLLASALLAGGALAAFRGAWLWGAGLAAAGLYLVWSSRMRTPVRSEPITEAEAARILNTKADEALSATAKVKLKVNFEIGDQVKVLDGPFASFNGLVEEIDFDRGRVKVSVSIFGRATPVELDFEQVEKSK